MRRGFAAGAAALLIGLSAAAWLADSLALPPRETAAGAAETELRLSGIVVRSERAVYAPPGETLILAAEGGRVSAGEALLAAGSAAALEQCARDMAASAGRSFARRAAAAAALGEPDLARPLAALYEPGTAGGYELVAAEESALWSRFTDGLEYLSPDSLAELGAAGIGTAPPDLGADAAGKLVYGLRWYFAAPLPAGCELAEGARCELSFAGFAAQARVVSAEGALAVFEMTEHLAEALYLRRCEAGLILSDNDGR